MKHVLFPADEMKPGEMRAITVDNLNLVVVRKPNGVFGALLDRCPHAGAKLSQGTLLSMLEGDRVTDYHVKKDEYVIRCGWHRYEFSVETGRCPAEPDRVRVRAYEVGTEDGNVVLTR